MLKKLKHLEHQKSKIYSFVFASEAWKKLTDQKPHSEYFHKNK